MASSNVFVKSGALSPPTSTTSSTADDDDPYDFEDRSSTSCSPSTRKLNVLDKYKARVLFSSSAGNVDGNNVNETFAKKLEKQMAILKVSYPFLNEKQIRGKAWEMCGLKSFMGSLPRSGLSPNIKKEVKKKFQKLNSRNNFAMPKNPRKSSPVQKVKSRSPSVASTKRSKKLKMGVCEAAGSFNNAGIILPETPESSVDSYASAHTAHYWTPPIVVTTILPSQVTSTICFTQATISEVTSSAALDDSKTISGLDVEMNTIDGGLIDNQSTITKDNNGFQSTQELLDTLNSEIEDTGKLTPDKAVQPVNNAIVSSTCNNDCEMTVEMDENCENSSNHSGQITPVKIISKNNVKKKIFFEVAVEVHQEDIDIDATLLTGDLPDMAMEAETPVKIVEEADKLFKINNDALKTVTQVDESSSPYYHPPMNYAMDNVDNQNMECSEIDLPKNDQMPISNQNYCIDFSKSIFSTIQKTQVIKQNIDENINNISQTSNLDKFSLPCTPTYTKYPSLPACLLLSNFCSESDRAWIRKNLKPSPSLNYYSDKLNQTLKEEFNKIVPPHLTLEEFFNALGKTLEDVKLEVEAKVYSIIDMLEAEGY